MSALRHAKHRRCAENTQNADDYNAPDKSGIVRVDAFQTDFRKDRRHRREDCREHGPDKPVVRYVHGGPLGSDLRFTRVPSVPHPRQAKDKVPVPDRD